MSGSIIKGQLGRFGRFSPQDRLKEIESERRKIQWRHQSDYEHALVSLKEDLRDKEGDEIEEEMKEEIREWFLTNRDDQGKFPDYPSDDEGGSNAIFQAESAAAAAGGFPFPPVSSSPDNPRYNEDDEDEEKGKAEKAAKKAGKREGKPGHK